MGRNDCRRNDSRDRSLPPGPTRVTGAIRVCGMSPTRPKAVIDREHGQAAIFRPLTKYLKASNSFDYFVAERVQMLQHRHLCSLSIIHDQRINELQVFRPS